jgi:histidinol dehydrogenase
VDSFLKTMSVLEFDRAALEPISQEIITLAETEKLTAHANSIRVRFE